MKRILWAAMALLVIAGVALVVATRSVTSGSSSFEVAIDAPTPTSADNNRDDANAVATDDPASSEVPPSSELPVALASPLPPSDARPASVLRLADGDSFDIVWADTGELDEIRLLGINAPEGGACFGVEARDVLEFLTSDQTLQIEAIQRDEFGRLVANVWVEGLFLNSALVELGAALPLSDGGQHQQLMSDAQDVAEATGSGLWDAETCGSDGSIDLQITTIEFDAPGRDDQNQNGEWIEITNTFDQPVDLTAWSLRDESTRHRYSFPDGFVLAGNASARVYSGCGDDTAEDLYWCDDDPIWNNGGDTGFLVDPDGRFADTFSYSG